MAADEDNFEIDVYGEGEGEGEGERGRGDDDYYDEDEHTFTIDEPEPPDPKHDSIRDHKQTERNATPSNNSAKSPVQGSGTSDRSISTRPQGVKRKESPNDRSVDSGATTALLISDLHWWITEDDLRGWVNQAGAEDDLKEVTFNEHKVNGKSKGQAYLDFSTSESCSSAKTQIESLSEGPNSSRKFAITFTNPSHNPFKTMPKDAPARTKEERSSRGGGGAYSMGRGDFRDSPSYRGRGRGYDRGGYGGQGYNRNFSGSNGFNNQSFQNNMGMMNSFGFNRGGMGNNMSGNMGGMRGGRGGMNNMMTMGGMMGMNPMMAGMGMPGFQGGQFGPGMFNQGPMPNFGGDWGRGAKRQRQE